MAFKFEKLLVWQKAMDFDDHIHSLVKDSFPKDEKYILTPQIERAANSIILNIAEGCTGQSSAIEVVSCLFIARIRTYISEEVFKNSYQECEALTKMITGLRNSI